MYAGVRELKARLSEYLDRASSGEMIVVTDRGVPKAILGPVGQGAPLARGVREGWITPGRGGEVPRFRPRPGIMLTGSALAEDREVP